MKGITTAIFLLFILAFGMALAQDSHRRIGPVKEEYENLIREIEIKKKRHDDLQSKEKSLLERLDRLARLLNRRDRERRDLEKKISQAKRAISSQEIEVSRLQDQMSATQDQLRTRLGALYRISRVGPWAFLLSAESYRDLLQMSTFLSSMINHDVNLLTTFENQLEQREAIQRELAANQNRLFEKQKKVRRKAQEVKRLRRKHERTLNDVRAAKTSFAKLIEDLEKQARRLQSLIQTLPGQSRTPSQRGDGFRTLKGRLPLPVAGKILKNSQRGLRGIFLGAPQGATARAVYRGRVVYADWFTGYGNLLIIDHGDRFHTVIGHALELLKGVNDWVETGEPIAKVGGTGLLGGASLYFEVRQDGKPVDPVEWFSQEARLALK